MHTALGFDVHGTLTDTKGGAALQKSIGAHTYKLSQTLSATNPDISPTKFFAGRGAVHEAVVIYCKCSATKQLRKILLGLKGELFGLKRKTPCF